LPLTSEDEFCALLEDALKGRSKDEFIGKLGGLCPHVRTACRAFSAANSLFSGGDVKVDELPDDLRQVLKEIASGIPPVGSVGWLARTFLGVRVSGGGSDASVVRSGGVGEWVCGGFVRRIESLGNGLRCLEGVEGRAEALITLSRFLSTQGTSNLRAALAGVSESLLDLLPGVSRYATLAWLLRFTSMPSIREGLRACGFRDAGALKSLLEDFSPAVFNLSECRLYRDVREVPGKLLSRGEYLLTSGSVVVRREGWEGRDYVIYGEEVPASPIYGFLNAVTEGWVRAEEILFGTSPTLKALEGFIEANLRGTKLRLSARSKRVVEAALKGEEFKVVTLPGKDEFSAEDKALVLELTQVVTYGVMNASVGWDGVKRGNAVINRYAVRFKPTYVLKASKSLQALVTSRLLHS